MRFQARGLNSFYCTSVTVIFFSFPSPEGTLFTEFWEVKIKLTDGISRRMIMSFKNLDILAYYTIFNANTDMDISIQLRKYKTVPFCYSLHYNHLMFH